MADWIQTFTKREIDIENPREEDIDIVDIAHSLSLQCRFNGHCNQFYSVAEHSIRMAMASLKEEPFDFKLARECLLHDASEAYLCDIPRPVKPFLIGYKGIENTLMIAIAKKYDFTWPLKDKVKELDEILLITEARDLLDTDAHQKWNTDPKIAPLKDKIRPIDAKTAETYFLQLYRLLSRGIYPAVDWLTED